MIFQLSGPTGDNYEKLFPFYIMKQYIVHTPHLPIQHTSSEVHTVEVEAVIRTLSSLWGHGGQLSRTTPDLTHANCANLMRKHFSRE
jgi:hypothetical protein